MNPIYMIIGQGLDTYLLTQELAAENLYNAADLINQNYMPTLTNTSQINFYREPMQLLIEASYSSGLLEWSNT